MFDFDVRIIHSKRLKKEDDEERVKTCSAKIMLDQNGTASASMILFVSQYLYEKMFKVAISKPELGEIEMNATGAKMKDVGSGRFEATVEIEVDAISFKFV